MNTRSLLAALLCALAVFAAALPAYAGDDGDLPPLTPKGQYLVITRDDATSSSKCIGNPITPLCAVETFIACVFRNSDLCAIAFGLDHNPGIVASNDPGEFYRVVRREVLDDRHFPWYPKPDPWRPGQRIVQVGDVRIDVDLVTCGREAVLASCLKIGHMRVTCVVRRQGNRWAVIDTGTPGETRH